MRGYLLIHGIFGAPEEMAPIAQALEQAGGNRARIVTLPGHGAQPTDTMANLEVEDLINHCRVEYARLAAEVDEVTIVGHSLGGLTTLLLAAEQPEKLDRIAVFSAPFEHTYMYTHPHLFFKKPMREWPGCLRYASDAMTGFERPTVPLWQLPKVIQNAFRVIESNRTVLHQVEVPVLLAHALHDLVIPHVEMEKLARGLKNAPLIETHTLYESGHKIFPASRDIDRATGLLLDFARTPREAATCLR